MADRKSRYIDLSHRIHENMPVYPGDSPVRIRQETEISSDGYAARSIHLSSHTGTHVDAPAHMVDGGSGLDGIPLDRFIGKAFILDCRRKRGVIDVDCIRGASSFFMPASILLLQTGWDRLWGTPDYFQGYPVLHPKAARILEKTSLSAIGIDAPSFDASDSEDYPIHRVLLGAGKILIENLTGFALLPRRDLRFCAFPLLFGQGADGSPVRAVAWTEENGESTG